MQHLRSLQQANLAGSSVVTIGVFDGVHLGHQYLVDKLVNSANDTNHIPVVLTFYPHPETVLRSVEPGYYLTLPDDKARLLGELGVEVVVTHPFDEDVRRLRAADFVDQLLEHLKMQSLWVGEDFAMGYKREGDVDFLRQQTAIKDFEVRAVDLMDAGNMRVSSSRVRAHIHEGNVGEAAKLMGRPHTVVGDIIKGESRGRLIGYPTANFDLPVEIAVPAKGVYAGFATIDGDRLAAVTNVGDRPTFEDANGTTVEAHLLDWEGDLYGKQLQLNFTHRLRAEMKFSGVDALVEQIASDVEIARQLLANYGGQ